MAPPAALVPRADEGGRPGRGDCRRAATAAKTYVETPLVERRIVRRMANQLATSVGAVLGNGAFEAAQQCEELPRSPPEGSSARSEGTIDRTASVYRVDRVTERTARISAMIGISPCVTDADIRNVLAVCDEVVALGETPRGRTPWSMATPTRPTSPAHHPPRGLPSTTPCRNTNARHAFFDGLAAEIVAAFQLDVR